MKQTGRTGTLLSLLVAVSVATLACSDAIAPVDIGGVTVRAEAGQIAITNRTEQPVFYYVVGDKSAPLYDPYICLDESRCLTVAPGQTHVVPYPTFQGEPEKGASLTWWHAVMGADGQLTVDSFRTRRFVLPPF